MTLICKLPAQGLIDEVYSQVASRSRLKSILSGAISSLSSPYFSLFFPSEGDNSLTAYQQFNDRSLVIHLTKAAEVLFYDIENKLQTKGSAGLKTKLFLARTSQVAATSTCNSSNQPSHFFLETSWQLQFFNISLAFQIVRHSHGRES